MTTAAPSICPSGVKAPVLGADTCQNASPSHCSALQPIKNAGHNPALAWLPGGSLFTGHFSPGPGGAA